MEKIYPELVMRDSEGKPFAVAYQVLPVLLLNEMEKDRRTIEQQKTLLEKQDAQLQKLEQRLSILEKRHGH